MLAKALFEKVPVSVKLHPVILKRMVGNARGITLDDLRGYDEQIFKSLKYLATDPTVDFDDLDMRFSIIDEEGQEIELIENGRNIQV